MNWEMYGVTIAAIGLVYSMLRNLRKDIGERFDKVDARFDRVEAKAEENYHTLSLMIDTVRTDISDVKERLAFLESAHIYTMPLEPQQPNQRSQAARDMWRRRRQKRIEKVETKE